MFTDYDAETFKYHEYPEMSRLSLHKNVCCNPECICSSHVTVRLLLLMPSLSGAEAEREEKILIYFYHTRLKPFFSLWDDDAMGDLLIMFGCEVNIIYLEMDCRWKWNMFDKWKCAQKLLASFLSSHIMQKLSSRAFTSPNLFVILLIQSVQILLFCLTIPLHRNLFGSRSPSCQSSR